MFCNYCGQRMNENDALVLGDLQIVFPYGSKRDGDEWSFSLCSECYDKLADKFFDKCTITPKIKEFV